MSLPAPKITPTPAPEHAVIYVGAASVAMLIGVRNEDGAALRPIEHLDRPLPLARDIFRGGSITRGTVEEKIVTLQQRKREIIASTLTGEEAFAETLSWDEIRELLD